MITFEDLKKIVPGIKPAAEVFVKYLNEAMDKYEINTPARQAAFISQCAHETMAFSRTQEIASGEAYEGRKDLGNIFKGEGKRYKGRGLLQITGRANYSEVGKALGLDLIKMPELLETPQYACLSAGYMWKKIKGNGLADLPHDWRSKTLNYSPFQYITYRINGGQIGYPERLEYFERAKEVLT